MTRRRRVLVNAFLWLFAATHPAIAQDDGRETSNCGTSKQSVCSPVPALGESIHINFRTQSLGQYIAQVNGPLDFDKTQGRGLVLVLSNEADTPKIEVPRHIFFGEVVVVMQAAPDQGIATTLALVSPDGDEIDFEWTGADDKTVQTNWFNKGNTSTYDRVGYHPINGSSSAFHTYKINWGTRYLQWSIDGTPIRTVSYSDKDDGTSHGFPQAPMSVRIGCWVAGGRHASPGNIEWSGGAASFANGPKRAYIRSLNITDDASNRTVTGIPSTGTTRKPQHYTWDGLSGLYTTIHATYDNVTGTVPETPIKTSIIDHGGGGLGTEAIVGIVVGFVAAFAIIGFLTAVILAQRRKKAKQEEEDVISAKEMELRNFSVDEVGGVDNKPELDGSVLAEMSGDNDKEAQELEGKGNVRVEISEHNNPQELSPVGSDESEESYYEKLRAVNKPEKQRGLAEKKDEGDV